MENEGENKPSGDIAMDKWVRVMAEHGSDGLWNKLGEGVSCEDLPVDQILRNRLLAWNGWYEEVDPFAPGDPAPDWPLLTAEGLAIARAIKRQLKDWTIVYFDLARYEIHKDQFDENQDKIQYEVLI